MLEILILVSFFIFLILFALKKRVIRLEIISGSEKSIIKVELADNPLKRIIGLMFRKRIGSDGMLFVFDKPARYGFWMLFTRIPLDIIFLSEDCIVNEVISMEPLSLEQKSPIKLAKYVLETEKGKLRVIPGKTKIIIKN